MVGGVMNKDEYFTIFKNYYSINMFQFNKRPYNLLLLTAVIILIASFFAFDQTIDIHFNDTYFIIATKLSFWIIVILLLMFWILYLLVKRILFSKVLTWINVILLVVTSTFFVVISFYSNYFYEGLAGMPRRYYDYNSWNTLTFYNNLTKGVLVTILLVILGLIIFIINLVIGLVKKYKGQSSP
jgi:cytochrome c oxidase subunit I